MTKLFILSKNDQNISYSWHCKYTADDLKQAAENSKQAAEISKQTVEICLQTALKIIIIDFFDKIWRFETM